jgi:hypothetical protein
MKTHIIHHHTTLLFGIALIIVGFLARTLISRRRFNRRGVAGLQLFSSYTKWLITTRLESLFNLIAFLFILAGIVLTACGWYAHV